MKKFLCPAYLSLLTLAVIPGPIFSQPIEITASEYNFNLGSTTLHKIIGHDAEIILY